LSLSGILVFQEWYWLNSRKIKMKIASILLAAGGSVRMGGKNKLLFTINGKTMIDAVCEIVETADFSPILVITGYDEQNVKLALNDRNVEFVHNHEWQLGMSSSIKKGILALPKDVFGCIIILGDMPLVSDTILIRLKKTFLEFQGKKIIYPIHNNCQANPVLFPRKYFKEILSISGDKGCKSILRDFPADSISVPVKSNGVIIDCDTKNDFSKLLNKMEGK